MQRLTSAERAKDARRALAALLLVLASLPSRAAIYQCLGADGAVVYSDKPCGSDAKVITVRPQAPLSATPTVPRRTFTSRSLMSTTVQAPGVASARPPSDPLQCQGHQYLAWYKSQDPKPSREQSDAMMEQIVASCAAYSMKVAPSEAPAANLNVRTVEFAGPQATGGGALAASPPITYGSTLLVSRSRQPAEARQWEGYYACRTKAFQDWAEHLGHSPMGSELPTARAEIDRICREQLSLGAGPAATLTD